MNDLAIAIAIHVLAIVWWIGGVAMVTTVILPAARRMGDPAAGLAMFQSIEGRFAWHARIATILAAGGHVMMTARAAQNIQDNVINNTGMVEATTVSSHNGVIDLDAGPDGTINDSGTLDASGTGQGQTGGAVNVTGGTVNVADGATINASGNAGGGTIQIGGGLHGQGALAHAQRTIIGNATITADVTAKGNGGILKDVAGGAKLYGMVVDYLPIREQLKGAPVAFVFPKEGVSAVSEPVAILSTAKNPAAAKAFIDFLQTDAAKAAMRLHAVLPYQDGIALASMEAARSNQIFSELGVRPGHIATTPSTLAAAPAAAAGSQAAANAAKVSAPDTTSKVASDDTMAGTTYTVAKGDTLSLIAKKRSVTVAELREWNNLKSDQIRLGQVLRVGTR